MVFVSRSLSVGLQCICRCQSVFVSGSSSVFVLSVFVVVVFVVCLLVMIAVFVSGSSSVFVSRSLSVGLCQSVFNAYVVVSGSSSVFVVVLVGLSPVVARACCMRGLCSICLCSSLSRGQTQNMRLTTCLIIRLISGAPRELTVTRAQQGPTEEFKRHLILTFSYLGSRLEIHMHKYPSAISCSQHI